MPYTIEQIKQKTAPIFKNYGVKKAYIFGSYAKGEQTDDSDVDIIVDRGRLKSLFQLCGLQGELSETLQKNVDLLTSESLEYRSETRASQKFKQSLEDEEILLYEERQ